MNRYFMLFLCVVLSAVSVHSNTRVYLINDTDDPIQLSYSYEEARASDIKAKGGISSTMGKSDARFSQGKSIDKGGYTPGPPTIPARSKKTLVMDFSRGQDLKANYFYNFVTSMILGSGQKMYLQQLVAATYIALGPLKKSTISVTGGGEGGSMPWYIDGGGVGSFANAGHIYTLSFEWDDLNGGIYHDITYTIKQTGRVTDKNYLHICQYNIQQRPPMEGIQDTFASLFGGHWHSERSRLSTIELPKAINSYTKDFDVVTVNEAFTASLRPLLIDSMRKEGYLYHAGVLNEKKHVFTWSGGVMVFSEHPIEKTVEYEYKNTAKSDKMSDKGVLYVIINKNGFKYHIFATHTNASYDLKDGRVPLSDEGRKARAGQFVELKAFIDMQKIPANEPVIIVGDMNVDMISEKGKAGDEYTAMLNILQAVHPRTLGNTYSLDEKTNEWVERGDGEQFLDYALYSKNHLQPKDSSNEVVCLKQYGKNICQKGKGVPHDLSDHYPLSARFTFPLMSKQEEEGWKDFRKAVNEIFMKQPRSRM